MWRSMHLHTWIIAESKHHQIMGHGLTVNSSLVQSCSLLVQGYAQTDCISCTICTWSYMEVYVYLRMVPAVPKINGVAVYSPLLCVHMCTQTIVMLCIIYYVYQLCSNRAEANNDVITVVWGPPLETKMFWAGFLLSWEAAGGKRTTAGATHTNILYVWGHCKMQPPAKPRLPHEQPPV